jgi:hypothetical protein
MPGMSHVSGIQGSGSDRCNDARLHNIARSGRIGDLYRLMFSNKNVDVDSRDPHSPYHTVLQTAVGRGDMRMVDALVNGYNADPNKTQSKASAPLLLAIVCGQVDIARIIHSATKTDKRYNHYNLDDTVVVEAARHGHLPMVQFLLDECHLKYDALLDGISPLEAAAEKSHTAVVAYLVGIATDDVKHLLAMLVRKAIKEYNSDLAEALLPKQWTATFAHDIDTPGLNGKLPLVCAARRGYLRVVRGLVLNNANVNTASYDLLPLQGVTALQGAIANEHNHVVKYLVAQEADYNFTSTGLMALHLAVKLGNTQILATLLESGKVNADVMDESGITAMTLAIQGRQTSCIKTLLDGGADPNCTLWGERNTPLLAAIQTRRLDTVKHVLQFTTISPKAIHVATNCSTVDILVLLLSQPEVEMNNYHCGLTPLLVAAKQGLLEKFCALCLAGADLSCRTQESAVDIDPRTILMVAAIHNRCKIIRYCLRDWESSVDVLAVSGTFTAMNYAENAGSVESVYEFEAYKDRLLKILLMKQVRAYHKRCDNTGCGFGRHLRCARCKTVKYCTALCQWEHWKSHKDKCRRIRERNDALLVDAESENEADGVDD